PGAFVFLVIMMAFTRSAQQRSTPDALRPVVRVKTSLTGRPARRARQQGRSLFHTHLEQGACRRRLPQGEGSAILAGRWTGTTRELGPFPHHPRRQTLPSARCKIRKARRLRDPAPVALFVEAGRLAARRARVRSPENFQVREPSDTVVAHFLAFTAS